MKFRGQPLNIHEHELALAAASQVARYVEAEAERQTHGGELSEEEAEAVYVFAQVLADAIRAGEWIKEDEEAGDVGCFGASP
jgi:hypothetical protein